MPNTLCHIAIQGSLCEKTLPPSTFVWVLLGCILPDIPWVEMYLLRALGVVDPYQLRYYCTAQASLFFCALLCGAIAMFVRQSKTVFLILLGNSLLHLLLDSLQIKWGNGVNIIAPLDWRLFSFGLVWTDTLITRVITGIGFLYLVMVWQKRAAAVREHYHLAIPAGKKRIIALCCLAGWSLAPPLFFPAMEKADTYFLHTLQQIKERPGKAIAFDRMEFDAGTTEITIFTGERLAVVGDMPKNSGKVSIRGVFITPGTVKSSGFHLHGSFRDGASLAGLFLTCLFFCQSLLLPRFFLCTTHSDNHNKRGP